MLVKNEYRIIDFSPGIAPIGNVTYLFQAGFQNADYLMFKSEIIPTVLTTDVNGTVSRVDNSGDIYDI